MLNLQGMDIFIFMVIKTLRYVAIFFVIFVFSNSKANTISGAELKAKVEDWLSNKGVYADISILDELKYPSCDDSKIIINDISGTNKLIKVRCIDQNPWQFIVRNKFLEKVFQPSPKKSENVVLALKNFKNKGSVITEEDVITIKKKGVNTTYITEKKDIIGKKLKKDTRSNKAIRFSNLKNDWLIEKNSIVKIVNNKSFITIQEEGIALNDGNFMEKIKVKNLKSGKILVGYAKNKKKVILNTKQN